MSNRLQDEVVELSWIGANAKALSATAIVIRDSSMDQTVVRSGEIEAEQTLVAAIRELITRFEQKIQATLARI